MLNELLLRYQNCFADILPSELQHGKTYIFNLNAVQNDFETTATHLDALIQHSQDLLTQHNAVLGIGRYGEERVIYDEYVLFQNDMDKRTIHLGIDLSVPVNTPIFAPLNGKIHSYKNNANPGDYGPTIILQHELEGIHFYTLYGHLSLESLNQKEIGQTINKGELFAWVGDAKINGGWPPHLHFQIIDNMENYHGDFPGVISLAKKNEFFQRCPDPNLILQIKLQN